MLLLYVMKVLTLYVQKYMIKFEFEVKFDKDKNEKLVLTRNISFYDVQEEIEQGRIIALLRHPNKVKYSNQWLLIIRIKGYVHIVPYVIDKEKNEAFLKTIYKSRKLQKEYEKK